MTFNKDQFLQNPNVLLFALSLWFLSSCEKPKERVVLKHIRDVMVDATTDPMLRANAIFYNPNNVRGKLKKISVDIYLNEKKVANVDQDLKMVIPAKSEFTIPLEVKLAMKELSFKDTLLGMLGGKKFDVRYEGFLKLTYKGVPIKVPVNYKDEIKVRF